MNGAPPANPIRCVRETLRPSNAAQFDTHDGVALFYRHWPATSGTRRGAIVLFHRGHEHSGRIGHLADELDLPDFDVFAWDARGHGESPGPRGHSPSLGHSIRDVGTFIAHITATYGIEASDVAVIAQSVGAVLVAAWAHDYAPDIRCMVLASPAFHVKLYVPFARAFLALRRRLSGEFLVTSYVRPAMLTHDPARIASFKADTRIAGAISANILLALHRTARRIVADARAITIPTQLLISGADWVVHQAPQHRFFEHLGAPVKERHILAGFFHDTLGERDRAPVVAQVRRFVLERFAAPHMRPVLQDADLSGFTRDEADALASPLPPWSPRGLYWRLTRLGLRVAGYVSHGIRLGHATGFDSGSTLDYVYRDTPAGAGAVGRAMDRNYLNSPGWRGIRQRKRHVEQLLRDGMALLRGRGLPVRILDIAAGHGRYVLEALDGGVQRPDWILLRDYSEINVAAGQELIAEKRLESIAQFAKGDAFDRASLAAITPRPTLGVVSGLYELFPDNTAVRRSLGGLADALPPGGLLLYTNQPWHPQLELIARALTSHRGGQAWVMRRRTQAEMDGLVAAAGFRKLDQRIDEDGIFTVSLAERLP